MSLEQPPGAGRISAAIRRIAHLRRCSGQITVVERRSVGPGRWSVLCNTPLQGREPRLRSAARDRDRDESSRRWKASGCARIRRRAATRAGYVPHLLNAGDRRMRVHDVMSLKGRRWQIRAHRGRVWFDRELREAHRRVRQSPGGQCPQSPDGSRHLLAADAARPARYLGDDLSVDLFSNLWSRACAASSIFCSRPPQAGVPERDRKGELLTTSFSSMVMRSATDVN